MKAFRFLLGGILCFLCICNVAKSFEMPTPPSINISENKTIPELVAYIEKEAKKVINDVLKMALPAVMEYSEKINVSAACSKDGLQIMTGLRNLKAWALEFIDSSGKLPDGVFSGSFIAPGAYDECLDINVKSTRKHDKGKTLIVGQYCMVEIKVKSIHIKKPPAHRMFVYPEELKDIMESDTVVGYFSRYAYYMNVGGIRLALCVPSGCKKEDIDSIFRTFTDNTPVNVTTLSCEVKRENEYTTTTILVIVLCALITFVVGTSSLLDYYLICNKHTCESKATRSFLAFSLYSNFKRLYVVRSKSTNIHCLHGIKFLGLTWVILGHTALTLLSPFSHGVFKVLGYTEQISFQAVVNANFSVDTFFFTGSFLVGYLTTKLCKINGKKLNILMYIMHRLWRLYPPYFVTIALSALIHLMGSGPAWNETTGKMLQFCYDNWWASLIFVNNIYKPTESCWPHTWYITVDLQLYIFSLVFLIPLIKWPKAGIGMIFCGILASILWCGITTYVKDYPPTILFGLMDLDESLHYFYYFIYSPLTHLGPYALGILVGYIYAIKPNYKMSRTMVIVGWSIGSFCCLSSLYGSVGWFRGEMPYSLLILYASLCRITWQVGVAWMVFACITGNGGFVNTILSWRVFVPLGRLTYCAYLLHLPIMAAYYGSIKTRLQPDVYFHVWFWMGHVCASYGLATVLYLFVEIPFGNLERIFFSGRQRDIDDKENEKSIVVEGLKTSSEKNGDIIIITPTINESANKF